MPNVSPAGTPNPGTPLPPPLRHQLEVAFGADLSQVRIHADHDVRRLGAVAYTHGNDIHFQPGFQPYSQGGRELIAHELTHVVQQGSGRVAQPRHALGHSAVPPRGSS
jgi:hypothetical protein